MSKSYAYEGLETNGFFLKGSIPETKAIELVGDRFRLLQLKNNRVGCALMVVTIENMKPWKLPFVKIKYPEAVWLIDQGYGDYIAVKAQTPASMVNILSLSDNYNTDIGQIRLEKTGDSAGVEVASSHHSFSVNLVGGLKSNKLNKTLVNQLWTRNKKGKYYRIPWAPNKPEAIFNMNCTIGEDSLGKTVFGEDVVWDKEALYFINRPHSCSPSYLDSPL